MENNNLRNVIIFLVVFIVLIGGIFLNQKDSSEINTPQIQVIKGEELYIMQELKTKGPETIFNYNCEKDFIEPKVITYCKDMQKTLSTPRINKK